MPFRPRRLLDVIGAEELPCEEDLAVAVCLTRDELIFENALEVLEKHYSGSAQSDGNRADRPETAPGGVQKPGAKALVCHATDIARNTRRCSVCIILSSGHFSGNSHQPGHNLLLLNLIKTLGLH